MSNRFASSIPRAVAAVRSAASLTNSAGCGASSIRRSATPSSSSAAIVGVRSACSNLQCSSMSTATSPSGGAHFKHSHGLRPAHHLSYSSCSSRLLPAINPHNTSCVTSRGISSTATLLDDDKGAEAKVETEEDDDPCPEWQNPLHHNNPDYQKILAEDFEPGEEMPIVPLPPFETEENEGKVLASPELHALADEIIHLNMIEVKELCDRIGDHFGFDDDDGFLGGDGGGGDGGGAAEEEVVEEKTVFDLKLTGFDAKSKIKVIKEIRGITSLGLKEAKELVEGAPTTVKKDIKKEEAEELKKKLEAVGATIEIV